MRPAHPAALAALLALAALAPAQAWHVPGVPTLDLVPFDAEGYVAWRLHVPAHTLYGVDVRGLSGDASFASFSLWELRAGDLGFQSLINPAWYSEGGHALHLQLPPPAGLLASTDDSRVQVGHLRLAVDMERFQPGEVLVVAIAGFDGALAGEFRLIGAEGVRLLGRTTGPAFLHHDTDFRGTASVLARAEDPVRGTVAEAKAAHAASVAEGAKQRLFASFRGGADLRTANLGAMELSYDGPDGGASGRSWYMVPAGPPGSYTFRLDLSADYRDNSPLCRGLAGATCWRMPVWVAGADVVLP